VGAELLRVNGEKARREEEDVRSEGQREALSPTGGRAFNPTLVAALAALAGWVVLAFAVRVAAGWVHLLLAAGVLLLVRRVVTGPRDW
jgi:hypothetical protein